MSFIQKAYLMKGHSARIYKELAIGSKAHSAALYARFQAWGEQDNKHAEILYEQVLAETPALTPSIAFPVMLKHQETDPAKLITLFAQGVVNLEAIAVTVMKEANLEAFAQISTTRVGEMQRVIKYAANNSIFAASSPVDWICTKCGWMIKTKELPDECPCCAAKTGAFVRFHEIGE